MPTRSSRRLGIALLVLACSGLPARAHTDEATAIPETPGGRFSAAAALRSLAASGPLPSQRLPGYLLLGDPGVDARGGQLEHGVVQLGVRFAPAWGAELALGAHGSDPPHVESAWLQGRGSAGEFEWTLGAGRHDPSLGPVIGPAGHLDRFGLMPLAKHAVTNGDWLEDGTELGLKGHAGELDAQLDVGLWSGRHFPGGAERSITPQLHAGLGGDSAHGDWAVDAFAAWLRPSRRGARFASTSGGHSHDAPTCDERLDQVVCFDGRSRIAGVGARWQGRDWPVDVEGAVLWRHESGTLQSRDGLADYRGRIRGSWLQAGWRPTADASLALRSERLAATQALVGPGANLVAREAGMDGYAPQRRTAAMVGWSVHRMLDLRVEAGRERAGTASARFVALRVLVQWDHAFAWGDR